MLRSNLEVMSPLGQINLYLNGTIYSSELLSIQFESYILIKLREIK